ncbi:hypothetical protein K435DRAFT_798540 [Dendrothele bispora CBS 962.96]|uniref:Uncharacterized protein n=1 Tax=Dendrothele bispora (strain CBS 962.96) TaxID=1314807 RepID=A0A4S8LYW6_DENBC|nr:hypothetical protein K435DRAFT_798540 [Dendrothele bispora CBS 962.96]
MPRLDKALDEKGVSVKTSASANATPAPTRIPRSNKEKSVSSPAWFSVWFSSMREKYEDVIKLQNRHQKDLDVAGAKMKKLQEEIDLLLEAMLQDPTRFDIPPQHVSATYVPIPNQIPVSVPPPGVPGGVPIGPGGPAPSAHGYTGHSPNFSHHGPSHPHTAHVHVSNHHTHPHAQNLSHVHHGHSHPHPHGHHFPPERYERDPRERDRDRDRDRDREWDSRDRERREIVREREPIVQQQQQVPIQIIQHQPGPPPPPPPLSMQEHGHGHRSRSSRSSRSDSSTPTHHTNGVAPGANGVLPLGPDVATPNGRHYVPVDNQMEFVQEYAPPPPPPLAPPSSTSVPPSSNVDMRPNPNGIGNGMGLRRMS